MWTYDQDTKRMVHREVKYVPGFFKIVDEILVNAADNKVCFIFTRFAFQNNIIIIDQWSQHGHTEGHDRFGGKYYLCIQ